MKSMYHGTDEQLELHALGRLSPADAAALDGHLLICSTCQEKFDEIEEFSLAMTRALREEPVTANAREEKAVHDWFSWNGLSWIRTPSFALAGGMALILLVSVVFTRSGSRAILPVAAMQLTAMRGAMASMPAAREMDLTLADGPKQGGPVKVEMVDQKGRKIWDGLAQATPNGVEAKVQVKGIEPGNYFVRLFSPDGTLVHEYGVHITQ